MFFYGVTIIVLVALLFSMWKDNRSLWNPALLVIEVFFLYLSIANFFFSFGYENLHFLMILGILLIPVLILLSGVFLIVNGFILLKKEGFSKANLLSSIMGIVILFFFVFMWIRVGLVKNEFFFYNPWIDILLMFIIYSYIIFGFAFVGFMMYSFVYLWLPKKKHYDFIIIHGAGLLNGERVTPLLKRRIDKAVKAFHQSKNPYIQLIASGGQGRDEKISEAQAIYNYLVENTDVPKEAILLEEKSTTTYENLLFSKEIGEQLVEKPRFLFVTNDYHVFRTSTYARQIGMQGDGLGCSTASYYIPSAFIREYVAVCVKMKKLFIGFELLYAVLVIMAYRGILW
ncbi:YdcF family protein [uncultured Granulicatella sp.]|uniref:YdcF family protein n=1 Tax=uncultured Granulicatella sp. TaxID=316089 RepID=UPI0028DC7CCB|nr:YdcF family protein [uncultured Granulicatella sp.]